MSLHTFYSLIWKRFIDDCLLMWLQTKCNNDYSMFSDKNYARKYIARQIKCTKNAGSKILENTTKYSINKTQPSHMHAMVIPLCCFRGRMTFVSICWKWTISCRDAYRFRTRTTLLSRLKSEARSRRRFYDNWAARGALSTASPDAIED